MKNTKKLYETIMASVAKQVKKAINEGEYRNDYSSREDYEDEGLDVQGDTEAWIDGVRKYLDDNIESEMTLKWYVTLVPAYDEVDRYEARRLATLLMLAVDKDGHYDVSAFDEVFIDPVTDELINSSLINEFIEKVNNLNQLDINDFGY